MLRPLIGMDKLEITEQAHALGTFEISIEPDADCCTLFVPRHPATRDANRGGGRGAWRRASTWPRLVEHGRGRAPSMETLEFPAGGRPRARRARRGHAGPRAPASE